MQIAIVEHYSVALDMLDDLSVLDAGSRGGAFGRFFRHRCHPVIALDPDPLSDEAERLALVGPADNGKTLNLVLTSDPEARYVSAKSKGDLSLPVECISIEALMAKHEVKHWDVVKLNIEGSEFDVLANWPGMISNQIVVSFHEHAHPRGDDAIEGVMAHLDKWYARVRHIKEPRYGCSANWWDTLVIRKDWVK